MSIIPWADTGEGVGLFGVEDFCLPHRLVESHSLGPSWRGHCNNNLTWRKAILMNQITLSYRKVDASHLTRGHGSFGPPSSEFCIRSCIPYLFLGSPCRWVKLSTFASEASTNGAMHLPLKTWLPSPRPYLIDYMFHRFPSENCDPGGG